MNKKIMPALATATTLLNSSCSTIPDYNKSRNYNSNSIANTVEKQQYIENIDLSDIKSNLLYLNSSIATGGEFYYDNKGYLNLRVEDKQALIFYIGTTMNGLIVAGNSDANLLKNILKKLGQNPQVPYAYQNNRQAVLYANSRYNENTANFGLNVSTIINSENNNDIKPYAYVNFNGGNASTVNANVGTSIRSTVDNYRFNFYAFTNSTYGNKNEKIGKTNGETNYSLKITSGENNYNASCKENTDGNMDCNYDVQYSKGLNQVFNIGYKYLNDNYSAGYNYGTRSVNITKDKEKRSVSVSDLYLLLKFIHYEVNNILEKQLSLKLPNNIDYIPNNFSVKNTQGNNGVNQTIVETNNCLSGVGLNIGINLTINHKDPKNNYAGVTFNYGCNK